MDRFRTNGTAVLVGHVVCSLLRNIVLLVLAVTWLATAAGLLAGSVESANALDWGGLLVVSMVASSALFRRRAGR
jgi:hypothetical protein